MASESKPTELPLRASPERLARGEELGPAALQAYLGSTLVSMAFQPSAGEELPAAPYAAGRAGELESLAQRALGLVERDAERVAGPPGDEAAARKDAGRALENALETLEVPLAALRLAAAGAPAADPSRAGRLVAGALSLLAALEEGAAHARARAARAHPGEGEREPFLATVQAMLAEARGLLEDVRARAETAPPRSP